MKSYIYSIIFILLSFYSKGQKLGDKNVVLEYPDYVWNISQSANHKYCVLTHGSSGVSLLDKDFKLIKEFSYNPSWGGGGGVFSQDEKFMAFVKCGEPDTLVVYNIETKVSKQILGGCNNNFKSLKSNKLLVDNYNGSFSIYDFNTGNYQKNVLTAIKGKISSMKFDVSSDETLLYLAVDNKSIEVYRMSDFTWVRTMCKVDFEIDNMQLSQSGKILAYTSAQKLYLYSITDNKLLTTIDCKIGNLFEMEFAKNEEYLLLGGKKGKILSLNLKTLKLKKIASTANSETVDGICIDDSKGIILVGTDTKLISYKLIQDIKK